MAKRAEYIFALNSGRNAEIGDPNPYKGRSLALAKCWARGYNAMLTIRWAGTSAMQRYRAGRAEPE